MADDSDSRLSKWLLNREQHVPQDLREEFDMQAIERAVSAVDDLGLPPLDTQSSWQQLQQRRTNHQRTRIRRFSVVSIAATVVILIAAFFFIRPPQKIVDLATSESLVSLPDGQSMVFVQEDAKLQYTKSDPRHIILRGTAHFHVSTGSPFQVETTLGTVRVLGTSFEVSQNERLIVRCYSGKVAVDISADPSVLLEPGQGLVIDSDGSFREESFSEIHPSWVGELYKNAQVTFGHQIALLEANYHIDIERPQDFNPKINGALPMDDLALALEILEDILPININKISDRNYVIVEQ